jgi:hypothetical protein
MIHLIIAVAIAVGTFYFIISMVVLACRVVLLCVLLVVECLLVCVITVLAGDDSCTEADAVSGSVEA